MASPRRPDSRAGALAVICGILALTFLDTTVVSVALGSVQMSLHAGVTALQWVVDAYALAFASLMLTGGTLGDRFGRRRLMVTGLAVFGLASLGGALAHTSNQLIAARAVMGIGAAASEPGTLSVLRHIFTERRSRARALGVWAGVSCLGLALGPVIGGVLVGVWDWRAVFWFNLAVAVPLVVLAQRYVPESADPAEAKVDLPGQLLGVVTVATLVIAVIQGETLGYGATEVVVLFVVAAVSAVLFVVTERRVAVPMLDLRYFRRPLYNASLAVAFATYFGTFSIFFFTALYLQEVVGYSGYRLAAVFGPMAATMVVGAWVAGGVLARSSSWLRGRWVMSAGAMVAAVGIAVSEPLIKPHPAFTSLTLTLALTGLGVGVAIVPVTATVLEIVPAQHSGMAASTTNAARQLGVVFGVAVLGSLVNAHLTSDLTDRLNHLGIPANFQSIVINAVEKGGVPSGGNVPGSAALAFGAIVNKVISAAYGAFHDGLAEALIASAVLIFAAGIYALFAGVRTRSEAS
jgi:EmrB/QacA subfamily drug resistance transporter